DVNIASQLLSLQSKWPYYATIALAQLPVGQGIPVLVDQLQNTGTAPEVRNLALRMLSQLGVQYPDAASALLEEVRQNRILDRSWRQIVTGLAGDQFMLAADPTLTASGMSSSEG